jgi:hypothetical protein
MTLGLFLFSTYAEEAPTFQSNPEFQITPAAADSSLSAGDDFIDEDMAATDVDQIATEGREALSSEMTSAAPASAMSTTATIDGHDDATAIEPDAMSDDTTIRDDANIANYRAVGTVPTEAVYEAPKQSPAWSASQQAPAENDAEKTGLQSEIDRSPDLYTTDQDHATESTAPAAQASAAPVPAAPASEEKSLVASSETSEESTEPGLFKRMTNWISNLFD